jgi:hypothetical protein
VVAAAQGEGDPWVAFHAGIRAYIEGLLDQSTRRIVLIDGPLALGWGEIRDAAFPSGVRLVSDGLARAGLGGTPRVTG